MSRPGTESAGTAVHARADAGDSPAAMQLAGLLKERLDVYAAMRLPTCSRSAAGDNPLYLAALAALFGSRP